MLTAGCISNIKTIAGKDEAKETFTVKVLNIYRYIVDKSFPILDPNFTDAFDIVMSDGRYKTKCLLSTSLNFLVYEHKLRKNSIVTVTECSSLIDEGSLEQASYVIIQGLEILDFAPEKIEEARGEIEFCDHATPNEKQEQPLAASRGYYLPLWNDEDYFGTKWFSDPNLTPSNPITDAITIFDLDSFWKVLSRPFPALIGRIVSKSRLNHYGKATDDKRKYPYQAYMELEDRTGTVSVCIWSSFCVLLYNYLQVGDIVAILNYRVTRKFGQRSNAVYNTSAAASIEISVNPTSPTAEVYKLAPSEFGPVWKLPGVPYRFIERKLLSNYSPGLICDIVGVVMFVSRDSRERKCSKSSFWASKWVHLKDGTSSMPIILHLYACSQPEVFDSIAPGKVLVCARMLLKIEAQDSKHQKFCFLTTTRESQLYVLKQPSDVNGKPFTGSDAVNQVIRWRQSEDSKELLIRSCKGGYYSFPPLPYSLELYKRTFPPERPMDLITTVNLGFILKELHFREHVQLHVQGVVVALEFVPAAHSELPSHQTAGEVKVVTKNSGESSSACSTSKSSDQSRSSTSQHREPDTDSTQEDEKNLATNRNCCMQTRNLKDKEEDESSDTSSEMTTQARKKYSDVPARVNPKRKCKIARNLKNKEEHESSDTSSEMTTQARKKYSDVPTRVNPKRKCKIVDPRRRMRVRIKTRGQQVSAEDVAPSRKRKARNRAAHLPEKVRKKATPKSGQKPNHVAEKKGKMTKGHQRLERKDEESSALPESEASSSDRSEKAEKYYPFRILDQTWTDAASDIPFLGLSKPSLHEDTLPTLCSQGLSDVKVVPRADRQGFVETEGHWRLMIAGLNRLAIINAIFIPQTPERRQGPSEKPTAGVFLSALATGVFSNWYPVDTLLNQAREDLRGRRTVFVLDVYSHGQDKVEVIINRAY